jgi:hypothetical protein
MTNREKPIKVLIEQSSLGTDKARRARKSVSEATGRMLVKRAAQGAWTGPRKCEG